MKTFHRWLFENDYQQKPILFVGNTSAIIPSDHDLGIKIPDEITKSQLGKMAHSVYYEGVGEKKQFGKVESKWVQTHLNIMPSHVESYDKKGKIYQQCAGGMGPAILLFSNRNVNKDPTAMSAKTVEDLIRLALATGGSEGSVPNNKINQFIKICREELGQMLDLPVEKYSTVAEEAEKRMWPGGDNPGTGPLGKIADQVEKERRAIIVQMATNYPGIYFIGSGHINAMQREHNLSTDLELIKNNNPDNIDSNKIPQYKEFYKKSHELLFLSGLREQNLDIKTIVQQYLNSDIGKKYQNHDCKSVTRAFIQWAENNGMQAQALHLAPPSADFVQKNPQFKGKSGEGDSHIMPVINGYAVDFTARQFGLNRPYNNPLITPINKVKSIYEKFGYYTDNPDWFNGGNTFHLGSWKSMPTLDTNFQDEIL